MVPDRPLYDRPLAERPRLVKLGVKPGQRISVLGIDEPGFADELASAGADVSTRVRRDSDMIFLAAHNPAEPWAITELRALTRSAVTPWAAQVSPSVAWLSSTGWSRSRALAKRASGVPAASYSSHRPRRYAP